MRAITLRQPHAWATVWDLKDVENRSRNIAGSYRGPVAIHAGLHPFERDNMSSRAHREAYGTETSTVIVFGAIIGVADLVDVHEAWTCETEVDLNGEGACAYDYCSEWAMSDHWHLIWANRRPLARPIPYKGALGLWTLPDAVMAGAS